MAIVYKYIYQKVLGFTSMEGARSTELGVPYLYRYSEIVSSVSICPLICHNVIGRNFSAFNKIENHNRTRQYYLVLEKYWVTQSIYFRFAAAVELGMEITDGKILFCNVISEQSNEKNISMREYNNRTVYD